MGISYTRYSQIYDKIEGYFGEMNLPNSKKNELMVGAVIRNLEITGEASNNIPLAVRLKKGKMN